MNISLGTANFGSSYGTLNNRCGLGDFEIFQMLKVCKANKIKAIDTARSYPNSEIKLGKHDLSDFEITTKIDPSLIKSKNLEEAIYKSLDVSLQNLKIKQVDTLLIHHFDNIYIDRSKEVNQIINQLKRSGKIKNFGVSVYYDDAIEKIINKLEIDRIQAPFNILDKRFYKSGFLKEFMTRKIQFVARSIFLQGLLISTNLKNNPIFNKHKETLSNFHTWCSKNKYHPIEVCLSIGFDELVSQIIIGASSVDELLTVTRIARGLKEPVNFQSGNEISSTLIDPRKW